MQRKVIVGRCPKTGQLIERYVDHGPARAVPGQGRPLIKPFGIGGGSQQKRLGVGS